ncbi:MAG: MarR family transcriptional regulator [Sedimentisphaerales bacterium]|nr:MarR family transcriptional regulator [Sedimentisphaerales bacterium]
MLKIHDLPISIGEISKKVHRLTDACCVKYNITAKQFVLLLLLAEEDGITQQELVKRAASDPNTIRAMLLLLEKNGMVKRDQHINDGRKHHITITQKGRHAYENALRDSEPIRKQMYESFSNDELKILKTFLARLIKSLDELNI